MLTLLPATALADEVPAAGGESPAAVEQIGNPSDEPTPTDTDALPTEAVEETAEDAAAQPEVIGEAKDALSDEEPDALADEQEPPGRWKQRGGAGRWKQRGGAGRQQFL